MKSLTRSKEFEEEYNLIRNYFTSDYPAILELLKQPLSGAENLHYLKI